MSDPDDISKHQNLSSDAELYFKDPKNISFPHCDVKLLKKRKIFRIYFHNTFSNTYFPECCYSFPSLFKPEYPPPVIIFICSYLNALSTFTVIHIKLHCPFVVE